jgi:hypothetical protein
LNCMVFFFVVTIFTSFQYDYWTCDDSFPLHSYTSSDLFNCSCNCICLIVIIFALYSLCVVCPLLFV